MEGKKVFKKYFKKKKEKKKGTALGCSPVPEFRSCVKVEVAVLGCPS